MESRGPQRLSLAASISRSTSRSVSLFAIFGFYDLIIGRGQHIAELLTDASI